jgi:ABC-type multidrug transport system ATPase subunit
VAEVLKIDRLVKNYGKLRAVHELSLQVEEGCVFGLLGPNGSGKTTTLGVILDVLKKTSGDYQWFGKPASRDSRKKIGAILEVPSFYPYLSGRQNLQIMAKIKGSGEDRIEAVLGQVGLSDRSTDPYKSYSLGMKQRLAIAGALLADPPVLILDEPTNGLDPQGIAEMRKLILEVAQHGKTILLASHILDEVQKVCSHFAVLKNGRKIYSGTVDGALNANQWVEVAAPDMKNLVEMLGTLPSIKQLKLEKDVVAVQLEDSFTPYLLHSFLIGKGVVLTHLSERRSSLEQKFFSILEKSDD